MRKYIIAILFSCLLLSSPRGFAQEDLPDIKIDEATATFEKISDNNFKLTFQWAPYPGAHTYRVRYIDSFIEVADPVEQLTKSKLIENDSVMTTLTLANNVALFQVLALDDGSSELAQSSVYRATLSFGEPATSAGLEFPFFRAFWNSFKEMDPFAGWAIVAFIVGLLFYGGFMALSINRQVRFQNHDENPELDILVKEYLARWKANKNKKTELEKLKIEIDNKNEKKYCILSIFEKGLENHIANMDRINVSEEVDRDMEKSIYYELENLKLGNYSKRKKHITLNRVKMFGETAPMLGLMGTVSGLIVAFFNILKTSNEGGSYQDLLADLSSGIYSAIVTTIIGLIVGIILLFIHHGVDSNIKRLENAWHKIYIEISKDIS